MVKWENTILEALMQIKTGSRNTEDKIDGGRYPFFVRSQQVERINSYTYDCEAVLTAGDGVGTGKVFHYINGKFDAHQRVYVMSQFNGIDGKYFYYFFLNNFLSEVEKYTAKSSVDSVRRAMIADMKIPLPPLAEQKRIATLLSDMDEYITALEKLIAKKRDIKQGTMQELLTGKRRLPGFRGEWVEKPLHQIMKIRKERLNPIVVANARCIELEHIEQERGHLLGWTDSKNQKSLKAVFDAGDVLFGKLRPYLKKYFMPNFCGLCSTEFWVFTVFDDTIANPYVYYMVQSYKFLEATSSTTGTKMPRADWSLMKDIEVIVPSDINEQIAIAAILSDMDAEIDILTEKLEKMRHIKQGMMSELLTGRIRLEEAEQETLQPAKIIEIPKAEPTQKSGHNQQFDDAVMIAGIVDAFYSDKFPLGRKKVQKLLYLLRRYQDESTAAFKKKAAGPYADDVRYKGGEPIARSRGYIATTTIKSKGTTFAKGNNIQQALDYIKRWNKQADIQWLLDMFQYKSVDDLELLATVDMAICDLTEAEISVSVESIKRLISANKEWRDKLKKQVFEDKKITQAIRDLEALL